ncbi:hypothetical protein E2C01_100381 [Portunus trituberculatus]|uniref:Uncharacterized protein n=1 Tax=Portunus trituberculatus TaxID=210409 RepID=A0A5B7KC35_PORTR|nr:hypothetical protein [Portunus trituberculatus]
MSSHHDRKVLPLPRTTVTTGGRRGSRPAEQPAHRPACLLAYQLHLEFTAQVEDNAKTDSPQVFST